MKTFSSQRRLLVCMIGMDGGGKTTQTTALVDTLNERGCHAQRVPCRWDANSLELPLRILTRRYRKKGINLRDYNERTSWKKRMFKSRLFSSTYFSFIVFTYLLQVWIKVSIPRAFGRNIVCDRYLYDIVIDIAMDYDYSVQRLDSFADWLLHILPKPDLVFLFDLPEVVAQLRNQPKGEGFPLEYFGSRRNLYLHLAAKEGMVICSAEKSVEDMSKLIFDAVTARIGEQK